MSLEALKCFLCQELAVCWGAMISKDELELWFDWSSEFAATLSKPDFHCPFLKGLKAW